MRVRVQPVRCGADGVIHEQGQALGQYADMLIALRTSQSKYLAFVPTEGKLVIGLSTFFAHHTTFIVVNTHRNTHTHFRRRFQHQLHVHGGTPIVEYRERHCVPAARLRQVSGCERRQ